MKTTEARINDLWPQFDTHQIAKLMGLPEAVVYNALAHRRGQTQSQRRGRTLDSGARPRLELEELLAR